jgi:hypothetical protein
MSKMDNDKRVDSHETVLANPFEIKKARRGSSMRRFLFAALTTITLAVPAKADTYQLAYAYANDYPITITGTFTMIDGDPSTVANVNIEASNVLGTTIIFNKLVSSSVLPSGVIGIGFGTSGVPSTDIYLGFQLEPSNENFVGLPPLPPGSYIGANDGWLKVGEISDGTDRVDVLDVGPSVPEPPGDMDHDDHHHHRHHHHLFDDHHLFNDDGHDPTTGVPEPSTWAMMLLGFAGLAFAFRQSRRKMSLA